MPSTPKARTSPQRRLQPWWNSLVSDVELTGIGLKYDANDNEVIDREEAVAAVSDYFRGLITKEETIEVIRLYFTG